MSGDIECNIKSEILKDKLFALQVDERTDITSKAQLLVFARFVDEGAIVEDFLCGRELPETAKGQDVFYALHSCLEYCELNWEHCVSICTDGAPADISKGFSQLHRSRIQILSILIVLFIEKR